MDSVRGVPQDAHFFIAVCSRREHPPSPSFLFVQQGSNVLREREKHIESLQRELHEARDQYASLHRHHEALALHLEEQNQWALRTTAELEVACRHLTAAEATVVERTRWAQRLDAEVQDLQARLNLWRASRWTKLGRKLNLGPDLDQSPTKGDARWRQLEASAVGRILRRTAAGNPLTAAAYAGGDRSGVHRDLFSRLAPRSQIGRRHATRHNVGRHRYSQLEWP